MLDAALVLAALNALAGLLGALRWLRSESSASFWIAVPCRSGCSHRLRRAEPASPTWRTGSRRTSSSIFYALLPVRYRIRREQLRVILRRTTFSPRRDLEDAAAVGRLETVETAGAS